MQTVSSLDIVNLSIGYGFPSAFNKLYSYFLPDMSSTTELGKLYFKLFAKGDNVIKLPSEKF